MTETNDIPDLHPAGAGWRDPSYQLDLAPGSALIGTPASAARAAELVRAGTRAGLTIGVQGSGHGRWSDHADGLVIDTSGLAEVAVDADRRTARVSAGARWASVVQTAASAGLAPLNGSAPSVSAAGYLLGGGWPLLGRRFGWAADHVRSIDLITVDGSMVTTSAEREPELFWALRGGRDGFGLVTAVEIELVEVRAIVGGQLVWDGARTPGVVDRYASWAPTLPDELAVSLSAVAMPDLPQLPPPLRGRRLVRAHVVFTGAVDELNRLLRPLRELAPERDTVAALPYAKAAEVFTDPPTPHAYLGRNLVVDDLDAAALTEVFAAALAADTMTVVNLRHCGGALARDPEVPSAVGHRAGAFNLALLSPLDAAVDDLRDRHAAVESLVAPDRPRRALNFLFGREARPLAADAWEPATRARLDRLRTEWDPAGRFAAPATSHDQ